MEKDFFNNRNYQIDQLTGLYERPAIVDYARDLISRKIPFSLALIDIDNFKNVNDSFGHTTGDKVIQAIAEKIKRAFGTNGVVGRFGGDEFIVVIPRLVDYDDVWNLCRRVFCIVDGFESRDIPALYITCTMGLSRFDKDGSDYETLMEKTDKALYRGKTKGRSCFIIYLAEKHANIQLQSSDESTSNSLQMHNLIFKALAHSSDFVSSINNLFKQLSSALMLDHIAIQSETKLMFSNIFSLSKVKDFEFIPNELIEPNISLGMSIFYCNDVNQMYHLKQSEFCKEMQRQKIKSTFYAEISFGTKFFGYLRCDTSDKQRIWQNKDMDLLLTAAKAIAMILYYQDKELDEL